MVVGIGARIAKKAFKMTSKRKQALAKAQKASALARKGKGKAAVGKAVAKKTVAKKTTAKVSRKTARVAKRKAAIDKVESMSLSRVSKGTKLSGQKRVSTANFKGKEGKALKKASYKARLASSRAKYKQSSLGSKAKTKAIGLVSPTGIMRRKYVDLTTGENVRRNITRALKVGAGVAAGQTAALQAAGLPNPISAARDIRRLMKGN